MKKTAFEKQVKRRVTAREHLFFASCQPGLTAFAKNELLGSGLAVENINTVPGGIEFRCKPETFMGLILKLGSPSRILMRIGNFKADHFGQFEKRMAAVEWGLYLPRECALEFKVSTRKSALYHTDAIAERSRRILEPVLGSVSAPANSETGQTVYIRAIENKFTVSIDCSTSPLYKRGIKQHTSPAPLRENIAFAMLNWVGFSPGDILVDPMCGSGTFSIEAAMIKQGIPPGFFKSFAFESWPGFSQKTFVWQKNQIRQTPQPQGHPTIFASDINDTAVSCLSKNLNNPYFSGTIDMKQCNFFDLSPRMIPDHVKGVVMLNPPYGKRLETDKETFAFFKDIGRKLRYDFKGWQVGILLPDPRSYAALGLNLNLKPVFHGGLDIYAGIGQI